MFKNRFQGTDSDSPFFNAKILTVVFTDTMLMTDGAAGVDNGLAGRLFYGFPGFQGCLGPFKETEKKGGINTGSGWVDV